MKLFQGLELLDNLHFHRSDKFDKAENTAARIDAGQPRQFDLFAPPASLGTKKSKSDNRGDGMEPLYIRAAEDPSD